MKNNNFIQYIPKPLLDDIVSNKVVPIVGAGFAKNAEIPKGLYMPNWLELGKDVAKEINEYTFENALDALSYYEKLYSRPILIERLMKTLNNPEIVPGNTYRAFCNLFTETICTTNFDFLLEKAYRELSIPISVIATEDRLSISSSKETQIIKLHGDFNHPDKMVVTENDYDSFAEKNKMLCTFVSNLFITKTMLLIGYSLEDTDFRNIWTIINSHLGKMSRPAYCILVNAQSPEIARFERRNVKVINIKQPKGNYKTILERLFTEIKDYKNETIDSSAIKSNSEEINSQLLISKESKKESRLCFLSCMSGVSSQLRDLLYSNLKSNDITLMQVDDMHLPGENLLDSINATIRKSNYAIVDISYENQFILYEISRIQSIMEDDRVIFIKEIGKDTPPAFANYVQSKVIHLYSFEKDNSDFIAEITQIISPPQTTYFENAQRLFNKQEYPSSIVSAYSEISSIFYKKIGAPLNNKTVDIFLRNNQNEQECTALYRLLDYRLLRNKIVHNMSNASKKEAKDYLDCVREVAKIIDKTSFTLR